MGNTQQSAAPWPGRKLEPAKVHKASAPPVPSSPLHPDPQQLPLPSASPTLPPSPPQQHQQQQDQDGALILSSAMEAAAPPAAAGGTDSRASGAVSRGAQMTRAMQGALDAACSSQQALMRLCEAVTTNEHERALAQRQRRQEVLVQRGQLMRLEIDAIRLRRARGMITVSRAKSLLVEKVAEACEAGERVADEAGAAYARAIALMTSHAGSQPPLAALQSCIDSLLTVSREAEDSQQQLSTWQRRVDGLRQRQQQQQLGSRSSSEWHRLVEVLSERLHKAHQALSDQAELLADVRCQLDAAAVAILQETEGAFECPICLDLTSVQMCFRIGCCGHMLCRPCAEQSIQSDLNQAVPSLCPVCKSTPCPVCPCSTSGPEGAQEAGAGDDGRPADREDGWDDAGDVEGGEGGDDAGGDEGEGGDGGGDEPVPCCALSQQDVATLLDDDQYQRYLSVQASLAMRRGLFMRCPREGCGEGVVLTPGEVHFQCPTCQFEFCTSCGVPWHTNSTCDAYQEWQKANCRGDVAFAELHRRLGSKRCPKCGNAAMKESEHQCNKVRCGFCRICFCWVCGVQIHSYDHFNHPSSPCYSRLFHGVPGHA